jgi:hypothetical protein
MSPEEARQLILSEGLTIRGIDVCVRMGDDPGEERLSRVAEAIDVLSAATRHESAIDRELMLALWGIAYHGETQSQSWQERGLWRDGQFGEQMAEIAEKVEEFIAGGRDFGGADEEES